MISIFILDDDPHENFSLLKILKNLDAQVRTALSVASAEQILSENHPPDLILLNQKHPGPPAYQFLTMLRSGRIIPKFNTKLVYFDSIPEYERSRRKYDLEMASRMSALPVIIVSGTNSTADIIKGKAFGVSDYILKPADPERLLRKINECTLRRLEPTG